MLPREFIIIGTLIGAAGSTAYLIDTVKGKVRPNRVSFLMWSIAPLIAFGAQIEKGVGLEALMTFSVGFLPLTVFAASFVNKKAEWKLTWFDLLCGILSAAGLILWRITQDPDLAIVLSIVADGFAAVPTLRKAYHFPETEMAWPWLATVIGVILTLLTLSTFTFANSGFIIYILVLNVILYIFVQFRIGVRPVHSSPDTHS